MSQMRRINARHERGTMSSVNFCNLCSRKWQPMRTPSSELSMGLFAVEGDRRVVTA